MNDEQKNQIILNFRIGIISELVNPHLSKDEVSHLIRQKSAREHEIPFSNRKTISAGCIRQWLAAFKKYGVAGVTPKKRMDTGNSRSISLEDETTIIEYLEKHPDVPAFSAMRKLKSEQKIGFNISASSLSRLLVARGYSRTDRHHQQYHGQTLPFAFQYPLECVQVDCMHAFPVLTETGKTRKAILIAFMDDATRRIVYADFSFSEESLAFEAGIKHILQSHGRIQKLYTDNGSTFISNQTRRILASLAIPLVHSRPGRPAGRGKIERFFRTLRDQFLRTFDRTNPVSIGELNRQLHSWMESEYHRNPHSGLDGKTPLDMWLSKTAFILAVDPKINMEEAFRHRIQRKVYQDATVSLGGIFYEVHSSLVGRTVTVSYDPAATARTIEVFYNGISFGAARKTDLYGNAKVKRQLEKSMESEQKDKDENNEYSAKNLGSELALHLTKINLEEKS